MGEEDVKRSTLRSAPIPPAAVDTSIPQSTIQSIAETSEVPWNRTGLAKPNISSTLPPIQTLSITAKTAVEEERTRSWNTHKLGLRVGVDAMAAGAASILIAPVITMIDKGIMENASGRNTLGDSLKNSAKELLLKPHRFLASKPFALVFSLYFCTYLTANTVDTVTSTVHNRPIEETVAGTSKFVATSSANLVLCLYKDNRFTQFFGSATSSRPVPFPTFAIFTVRDCLTIFASFNLPPLLAPTLSAHMSDEMQKYVSAASVAQFATPAALQFFSTPLHLLGLDLYNRPGVSVGGADGRAARVVRDWVKSSFARMARIIPAFGVGGVVNTKVRRGYMLKLE